MLKPYYQDKWVTIYHGDCREILPALAVKVDLVLTDPPYNIGFNYGGDFKDKLDEAGYIEIIGQFRGSPVVISQYPEEMMRYIVPALGVPCEVLAWCYSSNINKQFRLINCYNVNIDRSKVLQPYKNIEDKRIVELIQNGSQGTPMYDWFDDIELCKNVSADKTEHPCPLPEKLVTRLLLIASKDNNVILDPFLGLGTTCYCAKKLNRYSIGIEIEEKYCEIAAKRLMQEVMEFDFPTTSTEKQVELSL